MLYPAELPGQDSRLSNKKPACAGLFGPCLQIFSRMLAECLSRDPAAARDLAQSLLCAGGAGSFLDGGAEEDRTPDLRIANATLSQLSYGPSDLLH